MDRRIQKTRESILRSYFQLLQQKQDGRITVSEIARQANIDRKTFYLHYSCADDVWNSFCDEKVGELLDHLQKKGFMENPLQQMKVFFAAMNEVFEENSDSFRILSKSLYHTFYDKIHTLLVQALIDAYSGKVPLPKDAMKAYCDFFISGLIHLYQDYLRNSSHMTTEQIEEVIMDIAANGISNLLRQDSGDPMHQSSYPDQ